MGLRASEGQETDMQLMGWWGRRCHDSPTENVHSLDIDWVQPRKNQTVHQRIRGCFQIGWHY